MRKTALCFALLLAVPAMVEHSLFFRSEIGALSVFGIVLSFIFQRQFVRGILSGSIKG